MNYLWFMARRLYSHSDSNNHISYTSTIIATSGVAIGLTIIILSISIVLGFKTAVRDKVVGLGSHIQVLNSQSTYSTDYLPIQIDSTLLQQLTSTPCVKNVQLFCQKTGMLKTNDAFQGIIFKGVDESFDLTFLNHSIISGSISEPFHSDTTTNHLVISSYIAHQLKLQVGSKVYAYFFQDQLRARRFTITAIYATNLAEHDRNIVFCDLYTTQKLLNYQPDQYSGAEIILHNYDDLDTASQYIHTITNHRQDTYGFYYSSPTINELYPGIFSWLQLLDLNVIVILILMLSVACFSSISALLILILERTNFIGTLKALGATTRNIQRLFLYYTLLIVLRGILLGDALGITLSLAQKHWNFIPLDPNTYYVNTVPILINWPLIAIASLTLFLLSLLALLAPTYIISRIQPSQTIRYN